MGKCFTLSMMKIFVIMTDDPKATKEMIEKLHYIKVNFCISKKHYGWSQKVTN